MEPNQNQNLGQAMPAGTDPMVAQGVAQAAQPVMDAQPAPQPVQPAPETVMQETVSMEQQMDALLNEPAQQTQMAPMETPKKKMSGMLIGMIIAIVLAVGGIGFGVYMMMSSNQTTDSLNKQIASLKSQNSELSSQVATMTVELTGEEALTLLNEAAVSQSLGYTVSFANVYAVESEDDEDVTQYLVKFLPVNADGSFGAIREVVFTLGDEGMWEFSLTQQVPENAPTEESTEE